MSSMRSILVALALGFVAPTAHAWQPHGDAANINFADVMTRPAKSELAAIRNIGTFAAGAGPVIAPDGTVYLGNQQGEVIALHADGGPYWRRKIAEGQSILASPVIGADGMVYVIGVNVQDKTPTLHRFTASGGWLGGTPFPEHGSGGAAGAAPNIWKYQGTEVIIEPVVYKHPVGGGHDTRLIALSTSGAVMGDTIVATHVPTVTGGMGWMKREEYGCLVPPNFLCFLLADEYGNSSGPVMPPPPSVAISPSGNSGQPLIVVSDHWKDVVAYTFSTHAFSGNNFTQVFRMHDDNHFMRSPPVILPGGRTIMGTQGVRKDGDGGEHPSGGELISVGPNGAYLPTWNTGGTYAAPTRLADGRVVVVGADGSQVAVIRDDQIETWIDTPDKSIVSVAASRTHFFVTTTGWFLSYDANSLAEVGRASLLSGGLNPPAIGPSGYVYALTLDTLHVFAPSRAGQLVNDGVLEPGNDNQITALPAQQSFSPPMTTGGNRLFACEKLDGDDCGKGDYKAISLAFCQAQGYAKATDYDVDSRKGTAETLTGQFCSKNKCKVFDTIDCGQ